MTADVFGRAVRLAERLRPRLVDLTGGAPELHPDIRSWVTDLTALGFAVQFRTNLVSLLEPEATGLAELLAARRVRVLASLPGAKRSEVDGQRGSGTWERSLESLRMLARLGYGDRGPAAGPRGEPDRPPACLTTAVHARAQDAGGARVLAACRFDRLVLISERPGRPVQALARTLGPHRAPTWPFSDSKFNPATRSTPAVPPEPHRRVGRDAVGLRLQPRGAGVRPAPGVAPHRRATRGADERLTTRPIAFAEHCLACTAGSGSS